MAKTLELRCQGLVPTYVDEERDGVRYSVERGDPVEFGSLDEMTKWITENRVERAYVTAFWVCPNCQPVGGPGYLCDECEAEKSARADQAAPEQK